MPNAALWNLLILTNSIPALNCTNVALRIILQMQKNIE